MSKLFDKKDVFSWSNCEEAKKYIGEEGYFRDDFQEDLACWSKGILQDVDSSMPVDCIFEDEENDVHGLFLPADRVKPPQPKRLRAFKDYAEFTKTVGCDVGDRLTMRRKGLQIVRSVLVLELAQGLGTLGLGTHVFGYRELFDDYEWQDKEGNWQTFGVEA